MREREREERTSEGPLWSERGERQRERREKSERETGRTQKIRNELKEILGLAVCKTSPIMITFAKK